MRHLVTLLFVCIAGVAWGFERTSEYEELKIGGWTVLVSSEYESRPSERKRAVAELTRQISHINSNVPHSALTKIIRTKIWLEFTPRTNAAGQFHVSRNWLRDNGYNPAKEYGVEMNYNMVRWKRWQPMIVLHELSHAYHHRVLRLNYRLIKRAFAQAAASGKYENVRRNDGSRRRAYSMTNHEEYFAELTEAYFGENDDQPFNRRELKEFDPVGFEMVVTAWTKYE